MCVCVCVLTKCQESFWKISNSMRLFRSHSKPTWDSFGISELHAIHNLLCHSIYIFDKVLVFFLSQIVHKWFVVSLMVWCFQIHASHALERDLLVSSCETFPLSTGLLGMTCDIWETFTFVGCDVCWILLNSKDF